eukprot:1733240-Rhodomonas_salina.1
MGPGAAQETQALDGGSNNDKQGTTSEQGATTFDHVRTRKGQSGSVQRKGPGRQDNGERSRGIRDQRVSIHGGHGSSTTQNPELAVHHQPDTEIAGRQVRDPDRGLQRSGTGRTERIRGRSNRSGQAVPELDRGQRAAARGQQP